MRRIVTAVVSGALFAGLIYMLKTYDVAAIGPDGTSIGFSTINKAVHDLTGVNMFWYEITDYIGYFALLICALFGLAGLIQLIKRKSLLKVDRTILGLGVFYVIVLGLYVLFEKFVINYRPIIMPGASAPEASFPSSHTMLIITVMASTSLVIGQYVRNRFLKGLVTVLCYIVILVTVCGRLYCGVHWFTDIVGGVLLSITLVELFAAFIFAGKKKAAKTGNSGDLAEGTIDLRESRAETEVRKQTTDGYKPKH